MTWVDPEIADLLVNQKKAANIGLPSTAKAKAADVFSYLEPSGQDTLLEALTDADTQSLQATLKS